MEFKQLFYGRRKARPIRAGRQDAMDTVMPRAGFTDPAAALAFPFKPDQIWFEIGFGNGDSIAAWHRAYPDVGFVGCEPFMNGVSNLCKLVADDDLRNLRIWNDIAQPLIEALPDAAVDRIYLLNSDPWPKKRHAKRRFIQQEMLTRLARILKPGGMLVMTTDHAPLADWMWEQANMHPGFRTDAKVLSDCSIPPEGWLTTRYEGKGRDAGRSQVYLTFYKA